MLYSTTSPYYQWFLTANKKQRTKVEAQDKNFMAAQATKNVNLAKPTATSAWAVIRKYCYFLSADTPF